MNRGIDISVSISVLNSKPNSVGDYYGITVSLLSKIANKGLFRVKGAVHFLD
jgi:hypothetical protein